jgi:hypothetical protein
MGLSKWTSSALQRIGTNVKALHSARDDESLIEDDPIGDFLSRKAAGVPRSEEEEARAEGNAGLEPQDSGVYIENTEESALSVVKLKQYLVDSETSEDIKEKTLFINNGQQVAQIDNEKLEEIPGITRELSQAIEVEGSERESPEATGVESVRAIAGEAEKATDDKSQVFRKDGGSDEDAFLGQIEEAQAGELDPQPAEESQPDSGIDSLLDVFKSEELMENPISLLSRELNDVDIGSLLEETKQIVEKLKSGPR